MQLAYGWGGKKDAPFIAGLQEGIVSEYDPTKIFTDIFFFDGAANVAKAGKVLEAKYPRSYALHGGEHVISLFFDDLSKHPAVKVSPHQCCCSPWNVLTVPSVAIITPDTDCKDMQVV